MPTAWKNVAFYNLPADGGVRDTSVLKFFRGYPSHIELSPKLIRDKNPSISNCASLWNSCETAFF